MNFRPALHLAAFFVLLAAPCLADVPQGQRATPSADEVVGWWRLAADQGDANAQNALGHFYAAGLGVPRDEVAAYMWFSLAAAQGDRVPNNSLPKWTRP
jgi:TPR repeat protein